MISNKSIDKKTTKGTETILIKLVTAVSDIESATSPSANLVKTFEVTPPGAAAINITPKANSTGVFNGRVLVDKIAQKINAFQQNNNLLVGEKSSVNTKPQLEIFADDVKCSHGCTIGQLDDSALFYLKTRGISEKEAKGLLTYAFANNVLENVKMQALKTKIKKIIANKIGVNLGFEL